MLHSGVGNPDFLVFTVRQDNLEYIHLSVFVLSDFCMYVCAGVNLLVGTENGLMLLDRSGQGKVYNLITRRRFLQMDVLEGLNVLVTISGTSNKDSHHVHIHKCICTCSTLFQW